MLGRIRIVLALVVLSSVTLIALAGDGYGFKCDAKECGFKPTVIFGGGMLFDQAMGWCHTCKAFKSVQWTRDGAPVLDPKAKKTAQPKPLAEVWVSSIGQTRKIYKCPTCESGSLWKSRSPMS